MAETDFGILGRGKALCCKGKGCAGFIAKNKPKVSSRNGMQHKKHFILLNMFS